MSEGAGSFALDLTSSPPAPPLPAPTTVSSRSLRPRQPRGRSSTRSSSSYSRSRSQSIAGDPQLLYPEDSGSPERRGEPQAVSADNEARMSEGASVDADGSSMDPGAESVRLVEGAGGSGSRMKRRRSASPVAGSSGNGGRRGKRRALRSIGAQRIFHQPQLL